MPQSNKVLEINNITFGYNKEHLLLKDFSLHIVQGEIATVVGPSGTGKSTLLELITKSLKPFSGSIQSEKISQVFQDPYTSFHRSHSIIKQIKDVASTEDMSDILKTLSLDSSFLEKKPHELSGGQLQRCSILRAILMKPKLLLLDEPTSALDNITQLEVMQMIIKYLDNFGILLITHDHNLASWCSDQIIALKFQDLR